VNDNQVNNFEVRYGGEPDSRIKTGKDYSYWLNDTPINAVTDFKFETSVNSHNLVTISFLTGDIKFVHGCDWYSKSVAFLQTAKDAGASDEQIDALTKTLEKHRW